MKYIFILFALFSLSNFACKEKDTDPPTLVIYTPSENSIITGPVSITGMVTDKELHQMTIKLVRDADGVELFSKVIDDVHDLESYNFSETYTPTGIMAATPATITVVIEDHHENKTTKTVKFTMTP